jgi:AraC family transcriptional regulator of adaptative response / DNA-3-methyladenine glycosylase II
MSDFRQTGLVSCAMVTPMLLDTERLWGAVEAGDPRFDGWFFVGVRTTGIYCRPSCPARTPKRENVRLFPTAAAAQAAGLRACMRCRPDATPGSPEWDSRADLVGRAMRLIADGVVDRDGVEGLARRLGYASRHVHRQLVTVVGAGPLALARAQRAQTARILLETTSLPMAEVAFAAGFRSLRQFNETVREVFAMTPSALRAKAARRFPSSARPPSGARAPGAPASIALRLPHRSPFAAADAIAFLSLRAVRGIEEVSGGAYRRSLRLPHGSGIVELDPRDGHVRANFVLSDLRDLAAAVQRSRALLDLDSDPQAIVSALGPDPLIGPLVHGDPGRRLIGHVDGHELAVRAVLGQQVSVSGARTLAARIVERSGELLERPTGTITHLFPTPAAILSLAPEELSLPASRGRALQALSGALARGDLVLDPGAERHETRARLLGLPGIGPWTAEYIAMRALRDPDAFLPSDLGVRHALALLGADATAAAAAALAERWRPYRAYALAHLWAYLGQARAGVGVAAPPESPAAAA